MNDLPVGRSVDEVLRLVQAFQFTDKHGEGKEDILFPLALEGLPLHAALHLMYFCNFFAVRFYTVCNENGNRAISFYNERLLDEVFVISRIINIEVRVVTGSQRLRLITLTETLIILDITKTKSNTVFIRLSAHLE